MSSIVHNQQRAYVAHATDRARNLADSLRNLSPAEQAAMLAIVAQKAGTPIDIAMLGEPGDWLEAREILANHLRMDSTGRWELGSGCHLLISELPR